MSAASFPPPRAGEVAAQRPEGAVRQFPLRILAALEFTSPVNGGGKREPK